MQGLVAYLQCLSSNELASLVIQSWVHIQLQIILQHAPKALQNAAIQISIMLLFKQLLQGQTIASPSIIQPALTNHM